MNLEKQKAFIIHCVFIFLLLILVYAGIKYVLPLLMPFIIGIIIAMAFRNPIDKLAKKIHIHRTLASILVLLVFYTLIGIIMSLIGAKVVGSISTLFNNLPSLYKGSFLPALQNVTDGLADKFPAIKSYLDDFMNNIDQSAFSFISDTSSKVVGVVTKIAGQVPTLLIKFIFTIVASFFFTIDYYKISQFIMNQFKGGRKDIIVKLKENVIGSLGKFLKAYSMIISITFVELSIGFWILGVPNPFLIGLVVAIVDIMPILGTGTILIPWSVISLIMGNTTMGIGMLVLYIFITVVRQILEPKIVGQQIGLHPIVTLMLMYVGAQLMGILGLLILPIMTTILVKLNKDGNIHIFRTKADDVQQEG
jgi:sporulation integral membrane protein YtvI